jgi:hypothetical protein
LGPASVVKWYRLRLGAYGSWDRIRPGYRVVLVVLKELNSTESKLNLCKWQGDRVLFVKHRPTAGAFRESANFMSWSCPVHESI